MFRPSSRRWLPLVCLSLLLVCAARPLADDPPVAAANGDAYIKHDSNGATWTIGNDGIELTLAFDATKNLVVQKLWNPTSGGLLDIDQAPDTSVTIDGDSLILNQTNDKMTFTGATMAPANGGVLLVFTFEHNTLHTVIHRSYACYPGTPTIETWTRFEAAPGSPAADIGNLTGWTLAMPNAPVRWINGLRGDNASQSVPDGDSFAIDGGALDDGETDIGSITRSSETFVPLIYVDDGANEFYGGMIWSGSWRIAMVKTGDRVAITASVPGVTTSLTPDRPVELPHTFFGYTDDSSQSETAALRQFALQGIRKGRPFEPLVTYNTWFPYGSAITEGDVDEEIRRAASFGVELFVLDAGWWTGAGTNGPNDFSTGLGSYAPDPDRFPAHLIGLADEAHFFGMKFGLWVEPERVALSTLSGAGGPQEAWLASISGSYDSDGTTAQLCLAAPAARKWVLNKLVTLIDSVHPDYIKWDNNFWINCDRAGHGHDTTDGNLSHVLGLYTVLNELRQRYPNLMIENVSGGGNRLDFGMLAYSDSAWMDDLTYPSSHVRHNLESLSTVFPPSYLLSFVIDSAEESLQGPDLAQIVRSRMPGILGVTYRFTDLTDDEAAQLTTDIASYKQFRDTITQSSAELLSQQAPVDDTGWDVMQEVSDDKRKAVVFAFKADADQGQITVVPKDLSPAFVYDVTSLDNGATGAAGGTDLMSNGVDIVHAGSGSRAHIIIFTAE